jgi:HEAT repeat protein
MCTLVQWRSETIGLFNDRLRIVPKADSQKIAKLISDLDSSEFNIRERATEELDNLGEWAEEALRQTLRQCPSAEVRRRVEALLEKPAAPGWPGVRLRTLRAIEVLEQIGTPEARAALEKLAAVRPENQLAEEARMSLERLAKRPHQ